MFSLFSFRARKEEHNYYYMTVDNNRMIDAGPKVRQALILNGLDGY